MFFAAQTTKLLSGFQNTMHDAIRQLEQATRGITHSLSAYHSFAEQLQRSTSVFSALQDSMSHQFLLDRQLFKSTSLALAEMRSLTSFTDNFHDLASANRVLTDLVANATLADTSLSKVFAEHNAIRDSLASLSVQPQITNLLSSLDSTRLLNTSLTSQMRLLDLETNSFGRMIEASNLLTNDLASTFGKFTRSYRDVIDAFPTIPEFKLPVLAKYAPIEYSLELEVLERISIETDDDDYDELPSVDDELASFDNRMLNLLKGARESLKSDNPDRARHVTTSIRELFTHILHGLAPDDAIRTWTTDANNFHNNRPTRRARLLYICREFSSDPLTQFVEDDVRAALTLVKSLNAGTHVVESRLTESQLGAIVYRMESLALFLLKITRND